MPHEKSANPYRLAMGARIAAARAVVGFTPKELAHELDITVQSLQQWECGRTSPSLEKLALLARALRITVDHLLGSNQARPLPALKHGTLRCGKCGATFSVSLAPVSERKTRGRRAAHV